MLFLGAAGACTVPLFFHLMDVWVVKQVFLSKRKTKTHMLSQNRVRVLGFSWLRLCRNQRWMLRTFQSSCLERPSNLFSSGQWTTNCQAQCHSGKGLHCNHKGMAVLLWGMNWHAPVVDLKSLFLFSAGREDWLLPGFMLESIQALWQDQTDRSRTNAGVFESCCRLQVILGTSLQRTG